MLNEQDGGADALAKADCGVGSCASGLQSIRSGSDADPRADPHAQPDPAGERDADSAADDDRSGGYRDAEPDAYPNGDGYVCAERDHNADPAAEHHPQRDMDGFGDGYACADSYGDRDTDFYTDGYRERNGYFYGNGDGQRDGDRYDYTQQHTDSQPNGDPDADSDDYPNRNVH